MAERPERRGRKGRKKVCNFCVENIKEIDYKDVGKLSEVDHAASAPGGFAGVVRGTKHRHICVFIEGIALLALEGMIAGGNHIHAAVEKVLSRIGRNAVGIGRILAVDDHRVDFLQLLDG